MVLSDSTKFTSITCDPKFQTVRLEDKILEDNYRLRKNMQLGLIDFVFYKSCFSSGSQIGVLYGLPKVHKPDVPLRAILSACNNHNSRLCKSLVPQLTPFSKSHYDVLNYQFTEEISYLKNEDT